MEEAIVTDVSEEIEDVVEVSPREAMVSNIVAKNSEDRDQILDEPEVEPEVIEDPIEETVTLQVDGKEVIVPRSQVEEAGVRTLQKETTADARLEYAASREQELVRREQELTAMEEDLLQKRDQQEVEPDEVGKAFADALYEDEDTVAKTITSITQSIKALEAENVKTARDRAASKEAENKQVVTYYHNSYQDIANDPDMHNSLNRRLSGIAKDHPEFTPSQVIDEAATEVYERFNGAELSVSETKKKMPRQAKKASGRKPKVPEKKPITRSDVIAGMRGTRGVQAY